MHEDIKKFNKALQSKENLFKALQQSLYRQALGEEFIRTRVVKTLQESYSEKEMLYRYYDHAERGTRQVKKLKEVFLLVDFDNATEWQSHVLEITDIVGYIAICFRAIHDYKEKYMDSAESCLEGAVGGMQFDEILHEIGNGVAHVRTGGGEQVEKLRHLNEITSTSGLALMGGVGHEVYSTNFISAILELLVKNFVDCESTYFDLVVTDVLEKDSELLSFEPYLVEKPNAY